MTNIIAPEAHLSVFMPSQHGQQRVWSSERGTFICGRRKPVLAPFPQLSKVKETVFQLVSTLNLTILCFIKVDHKGY
jgi:hypothetical protein